MSQKSEKLFGSIGSTRLIWLLWLVTIVFSSSACAFASRPVVLDPCETTGEGAQGKLVELSDVDKACELIYQGQFEAAGELIKESGAEGHTQSRFLSGLAQIVQEYEKIRQRRQTAQKAAYKEQMVELEKFRNGPDANDVNDVNDVDPNDPNDIPLVLLVIVKAREFADHKQKEQLLHDPFVRQMMQKAVDRARQLESQGKWLEAYVNCYYWLSLVDPNNEAYSDYADELIDKSQIAASFEDSPCETSKERYGGVKKEIFVWAIHALSLNYVSFIDYEEMATKAVNRCKLLAEVMGTSPRFALDSKNEDVVPGENRDNNEPREQSGISLDEHEKVSFLPPDSNQLSAWLAAMAAVEAQITEVPAGFKKDEFVEIFDKVLTLNTATAQLPEPVLIAQFSEAALSTLDPYTVMVWPKQMEDFEKMMTNEFTGIGIEISRRQGLLTVASLLPDTPAYNSGLDAGDVIEKVDGVETKDMTLMCAVHKITGPKGTEVKLAVRRHGEEKLRDITITRDRIIVPTIRGWQRTEAGEWLYMIDAENKIGYVRLTSFSAASASDFDRVLLELESEGLKGLILDLRFNTGGLLDSAVSMADKFLEEGLIVKTQPGPRFGRWPSYSMAHKSKTHPNYSLVILINSSSASASEIVAGALADKEHKRAILVGTRTHGKGSVQGMAHYPGARAQLKYTMAYYHLPSGQRVESQDAMKKLGRKDWGVGPNVEVELRSDELKEMIDVQRDNDVLVQRERDNANGVKKHTVEETLAADPQLAVGLLAVKSKMIQAEAAALAEQN